MKKDLHKALEEVSSFLCSAYVKGNAGLARYLGYKRLTEDMQDIKQHLTPYYFSSRCPSYKKSEIDEVVDSIYKK